MFEDDLELAKQFNACGQTGPARQHLFAAMDKLNQLDALPKPAEPQARISEPIEV